MGIFDFFRSRNRNFSTRPLHRRHSSINGGYRDCRDVMSKENVSRRERLQNFDGILKNISKFVLQSTVTEPSKGFLTDHKQLHKIVCEGLKDHVPSHPCNENKGNQDLMSLVEEMQTKTQTTEEQNDIDQRIKDSVEQMKQSEALKKIPPEHTKGTDSLKASKKRIMIRSRL
ncbi:hypothetical protein Ancab_004361 [Ancistrocladus abbreviatus]